MNNAAAIVAVVRAAVEDEGPKWRVDPERGITGEPLWMVWRAGYPEGQPAPAVFDESFTMHRMLTAEKKRAVLLDAAWAAAVVALEAFDPTMDRLVGGPQVDAVQRLTKAGA